MVTAGTGHTAAREETVRVRVDDAVGWVWLNRPERLNALTAEMMDGLYDALASLAGDPTVRVVVLAAEGRAFCAGADTGGMVERRGMDAVARQERIERSSRSPLLLHTMGKPTIAAINGVALGAGLGLVLACDLKVMAAGAKLLPGYAAMGLSGDFGVSWFASRQLGAAGALRFLMLNERLDAGRALALGLVDQVVEDDRLAAAVAELAGRLAAGPTQAFARMKANITRAAVTDLATSMSEEARHMVECLATADHAEAVSAFREKRVPRFSGC